MTLRTGRLCVMAKPPIPGLSKTRLAREIGAERAADFAAAFLADTWDAVGDLARFRPVIATTDPDLPLGVDGERWLQGEGDLGARIERILRRGLQQGPWAVVMGADSPGFPLAALDAAAAALDAGQAVLGPTRDGGFWLLGLPRCPEGLLAGLPWSAEDTALRTRGRLEDSGFSVRELAPWFDIDVHADLAHFRSVVPRESAPRTWALL